MRVLKSICILVLVLCMLCFTGCWNYRELDNLSMVSGFAIDKGQEGHKYHLTFELLNLVEDKPKPKLLESEGDTIFDAIRNAVSKTQKKLFFSHCKAVIISKELAEEGIRPLIDFCLSDAEPRLSINYLISNEKTAAEILKIKPITDSLQIIEVWKTMQLDASQLSKTYAVRLYQATDMLASNGISLVLPCIKINKNGDVPITELNGTAIFKKDKMIAHLTPDETKTLLFIKNQITGGLLLVNVDSIEPNITLEIGDNRTKINPVIKNEIPSIDIAMDTRVTLAENTSDSDYYNPEGIRKVEKIASETLKNDTNKLIKKVQNECASDIFGFGDTIHQNYPDWWKANEKNWDKTFRSLKCNVSVNIEIKSTSVTKSYVKVGE
jgi:spore germination protein KC